MTDMEVHKIRINIPQCDWAVFHSLVNKYGWEIENVRQTLDDFVASRPRVTDLTEEEISEEVRRHRYSL